MFVREIMQTEFPRSHPGDCVPDVFMAMEKAGLPALPVEDDDGALVGIISETDLLNAMLPTFHDLMGSIGFLPESYRFRGYDQDQLQGVQVKEIMTSEDLVSLDLETPVAEAARLMVQRLLAVVSVVDKQMKLIGIVTRQELVRDILATSLGCEMD
jgi:CBS domain-containing protein